MSIFRSSLTRALVTPLLAASVGLGLTACDEANSAGPDQGTTLEDLNDDEGTGGLDEQGPGEDEIAQAPAGDNVVDFYEGEPVTVSGAIVQVFNPQVFVIGEGDLATLVIRPDDDGVTLLPGTVAQVTGTAEPFVLADVEQRLGVDLVDEDFAVFETHLYIDAINVNLLDED